MKTHPTVKLTAALLSLAGAFCISTASAHHGQDFILLEDYHLAAPGQGHFMTNFEWESYSDRDEFGLAPGLIFGVLPRVGLGIDVSFRDEDEGWGYSNVTPTAHFQLTNPESKFPIRVSLSVGYQFADGGAGDGEEAEHEDEHAEHGHEHGHADHHEDHGDDHHVSAAHSHSGSIHNHDADLLASRLIIEGDLGDTKLLFNLISFVEDGGDAAWGYAAGARHKFHEQVSAGIEAMGDFESDGWHELVAGLYIEPVHSLTLKLGAGFGLTEETPDFTLRTGFVWRF